MEEGNGTMHVMAQVGSVVIAWSAVASAITFGLYGWDKRAAKKATRRVPEKVLLGWSALGGWPGGIVAGKLFRHKTIKGSYRLKFAVAMAVHVGLICLLAYLFMR